MTYLITEGAEFICLSLADSLLKDVEKNYDDTSKAKTLIVYNLKTSFEKGIMKLYALYKDNN